MANKLDALRTAKLLLDQHGAKEAWHILTARAVQEHMAGQVAAREITQQVLAALHKLTAGLDGKVRH